MGASRSCESCHVTPAVGKIGRAGPTSGQHSKERVLDYRRRRLSSLSRLANMWHPGATPRSEYGCITRPTHERLVRFQIELTNILRAEVGQAMNEAEEPVGLGLGNDSVAQLEELVDVVFSAIWRRPAGMRIRDVDFICQHVAGLE